MHRITQGFCARELVRLTLTAALLLLTVSAFAQQPPFPLTVNTWGYFNGVSGGTPLGIGNWPNGDGSITVTGPAGSSTLAIDSVNVGAIADYALDSPHDSNSWGIVIPGDDGIYRVYSVYAVNTSSMTLSVYPALATNSTSQIASNLYDAYGGPHLTTLGFYGLADFVVAQTKGNSYIQTYANRYVSDGLGNYSGAPWTAIGGLNQGAGGDVPPTNCMTQGVFTYASAIDNAVCNAYSGSDRTEFNGSYYQTLIGAATQGQGAQLTANLNGRSGYLDTFVGIEGQWESEQASATVQVYIDGNLVLNQNFGGLTHIQVPFTHATTGEIEVTVNSPYPCAPRISNTTWYVWDDSVWSGASPSDPLFPNGSKVLVLMDSWGTWQNAAFVTRLIQDLPNAQVTNVSVEGTTAEWAITNFPALTVGGPWNYIISNFQINDLQPDSLHSLTFAELLTNIETLWNLDLGIGATPIYLRSLATASTQRIQRLNMWDQTLTADYPSQIESQGEQQITFTGPGTQLYGEAPITLTATASSGLPVTYTVISGPATVSGSTLMITGAGTVTVQANQAGNSQWLAATPVNATFAVSPALLTVTANNATISQGSQLPMFSATYTGFVDGDTLSVLTGAPAFSTNAPQQPPVGQYTIDVTQGTLWALNYIFTFVSGTLTVNPAIGQITAPPKNSMLSGSAATFTWSQETGAISYQFLLGSAPGGSDIAAITTPNLSTTVNNLPANGSYIYATLEGSTDGVNYTQQDTATYVAYTLTGVMMTPAPNSTLSGPSATFTWVAGAGASAYDLDAGSVPGGNDYEQSGNLGNVTTFTVNNLPIDGSTVYVTLWSLVNGQWSYNEYQYTAFTGSLTAQVTSPTPGSTLTGSSQLFTWSTATDAIGYAIDAGSVPGGNNYFQSGNIGTVTSYTVNSLPTDGSTVYVTLFTITSNGALYNEYTYTAYTTLAQITSPAPGSTLSGTNQLFTWTSVPSAIGYEIDAGSVPGGNNYFQSGNVGTVTSYTVPNLPTDGSTVYVTLFTITSNGVGYNEYTYTASGPSNGLAAMQSPQPGSEIDGSSATFTWSAGMNAQSYELDIGSVPGGNDIEQSGPLGLVQMLTVNNLPNNGSAIYATLWTEVNGQWSYNEYQYQSGPSQSKRPGWKQLTRH